MSRSFLKSFLCEQLHRRTLYDDGYGVDEALDEPGTTPGGLVAKGKHWFIMSAPSEAAFLHRPLAYELLYQPILTFSSSNVENTNILAEVFLNSVKNTSLKEINLNQLFFSSSPV